MDQEEAGDIWRVYEKEKEEIAMPQYSLEDIDLLKRSLGYIRIRNQPGRFNFITEALSYDDIIRWELLKDEETFALVTINHIEERVKLQKLFKFLDEYVAGYSDCSLDVIVMFMVFTEFKHVPFYINTLPEFVSWRLKIGK